jgi:hypothetical protein
MTTNGIENALRERIGDTFLGVYPCDKLPETIPSHRPLLLIANTDPSTKPGEHWIAICLDKDGRGEYFDSFGRAPKKTFKTFLDKNCDSWIKNDRQLQSLMSKFCGLYTVYYCLFRSLNYDMSDILKMFIHDQGVNDWMVHTFVCRLVLS